MRFQTLRPGLLLALLALLFLQGCAGMQPFMPIEDQIEAAVEEGAYQHALDLIDEHDPEPADEWTTRREEIELLAREAAEAGGQEGLLCVSRPPGAVPECLRHRHARGA